jgi:hypothetical protein
MGTRRRTKEQAKRYRDAFYETHRDDVLQRNKKYRAAHREDVRANQRRCYYKNREEVLRKQKLYRDANKETRCPSKRAFDRKRRGLIGIGSETRNGVCPVCKQHKLLVPDHDHATGVLRDWICQHCNLRLGLYEAAEKSGEFERYRKYLRRIAG